MDYGGNDMEEKSKASVEATPEQILYANILEKGMLIGLFCLLVTFAMYHSYYRDRIEP